MSDRVLFDKSFSCDDIAEIKDIFVVFSPTTGKSKGVCEQLDSPVTLNLGEKINIKLRIRFEA